MSEKTQDSGLLHPPPPQCPLPPYLTWGHLDPASLCHFRFSMPSFHCDKLTILTILKHTVHWHRAHSCCMWTMYHYHHPHPKNPRNMNSSCTGYQHLTSYHSIWLLQVHWAVLGCFPTLEKGGGGETVGKKTNIEGGSWRQTADGREKRDVWLHDADSWWW